MPLIYRPASLVEAQLVVDELRAGGIRARIAGSYLSGAIGELPPTEVLAVWVDEPRHEARARELIAEFEQARCKPDEHWWCAGCGERLGGEFGACWQCGRSRPASVE